MRDPKEEEEEEDHHVRLLARRRETGAAAVEFALVFPILMLVVFGILQYGLYFFDAHGTRTGVREAARQGVVGNFVSCGGESAQLAKLKCTTKQLIGAVTGPTAVKVKPPTSWARPEPLVVCAVVESSGVVGLLPMPNDGMITTKTQMSIEVTDAALDGAAASADADPTGQGWSWC